MGRISFLQKFPPPPILVAHAHHHRSFHHNASNASPASFLLLIAAVAAGEVLAIFVCKIIANYAEFGFHSQEQSKMRLSGVKRRLLINRALVGSQRCPGSSGTSGRRRQPSAGAADDDDDNDDENSCPICLRDLDDGIGENDAILRPRSCSHLYHKGCITGWLEQHETCPLCRTNVLANTDVAPMAPRRRRLLWTQSTMWGEDM